MKNSILSSSGVMSSISNFINDNFVVVIVVGVCVAAIIVAAITLAIIHAVKKRKTPSAVEEPAAEAEETPVVAEEVPAEETPAVVAEEVPAEEPPVVAEATPAEESPVVGEAAPAAAEQSPAEEIPAQASVIHIRPRPGMFIRYRYNRSFQAKLIQSDDRIKGYYSELKNELLSYARVNPRISWRHESFRRGRPVVAKFIVRGKTLCLCLALNPADYAESKYLVDDMSRYAKFAGTPLLYRIKNDRRYRYAKELIAALFAGAEPSGREREDFSAIPYEDTFTLVEKGLIKVVSYEEVAITEGEVPQEEYEDDDDFEGTSFDDDGGDELEEVSAAEAGTLLSDDTAKLLVQQSAEKSDRTKAGVVNIDSLGKYFEEGERVTLESIKERVPGVAKNLTYIKVLARGTLDKPLIVVADDFSLEAVKMIVLTGGRAIRKTRQGN